jgi:hypothetical protein
LDLESLNCRFADERFELSEAVERLERLERAAVLVGTTGTERHSTSSWP